MKDLILKASVGASLTKDHVMGKVQSAARGERGDVVQVILLIALFVVIIVVVGGILMKAIKGQANKVGTCISNANGGTCTSFTG